MNEYTDPSKQDVVHIRIKRVY